MVYNQTHANTHFEHQPRIPITAYSTTNLCINVTVNMVQRAGIKVSVVRFGGEVLEGENFEDGHVFDFYEEYMHDAQTYVKVSSGERFLVYVHITPDFDFMGFPEAQIYCSIDGEEEFNWSLSEADLADLRSQNTKRRIHFHDTERFIDGRWMKCALTFGDLEVDARMHPRSREAQRHMDTLGRIIVKVRRGTGEPFGPEPVWPNETAVDITRSARAVVEGRHISHTLRVLPDRECEQPDQTWHFNPAPGRAGRAPERFEIHFRSQEALELLGVVPKTEADVKADPEEDKDRAIKGEEGGVKHEPKEIKTERAAVKTERAAIKAEATKVKGEPAAIKTEPAPVRTGQTQTREPHHDRRCSRLHQGQERARRRDSAARSRQRRQRRVAIHYGSSCSSPPDSRRRSRSHRP
jgi:hypothetical protein